MSTLDADPADLHGIGRAWIAGDPDPGTTDQLTAALERDDPVELADLLGSALGFGTAGLRGRVGPGPNRMNRAVVIRTTRALAEHVHATVPDGAERGIVVGFDARPDSKRFAHDVVAVLHAAGLHVSWFAEPVPTPLVAWAARDRNAAGAVVVTASHNPPADNGYKVYDQHAVQITAPTDTQIASLIAQVGPAADVPGVGSDPTVGTTQLGPDVSTAYLAAIRSARPVVSGDRDVPIVFTPLHGVAGALAERALVDAGFTAVHRVAEQWEPDGTFPTVAFPNPEEPGALDLATATADRVGAQVVLATDPDGDRLAVALQRDGDWVRLTGDQVGCLLAHHLLSTADVPRPLVASSIVSSARLDEVAAHHGARREVTLTGFKWIWRAGRELADHSFVLGYEEALGYSIGEVVRDKDGIAAAVVLADMVAMLAARGQTLWDALTELDDVTGRWANVQVSVVQTGPDGPDRIAAAVRRASAVPARMVGPRAIVEVEDLSVGAHDRPAWLPADTVVIWHLDGGGRVLVRPSGTEPKLKLYVDLRLRDGEDPAVAERIGADVRAALGLG